MCPAACATPSGGGAAAAPASRAAAGRPCRYALHTGAARTAAATATQLPAGCGGRRVVVAHAMEVAEAVEMAASGGANMTPVYAGLGAGAVSFVGTFGVLPRFRDLLKEPENWTTMYNYLVDTGGVKSYSPEEAQAKAKRGALLVDVRLAEKYNKYHPEGSINVPLYRPIQAWDLPSNLRRAAFGFFGVFGTELNPEFMDLAVEALPKGKEIVLVCENGGSLENKAGVATGFQSRALKAAYFLRNAGFSKVSYCEGGIAAWLNRDLPLSEVEA